VSNGVKFLLFVLTVIAVIGGGSYWLVSWSIGKEEAHCAELGAERVSSGRYGYICVTDGGRVVWH
jgi:hypothetical protein